MKTIIALVVFCVVMIFTMTRLGTVAQELPEFTGKNIIESAEFLNECKYFQHHWPEEWLSLAQGVEFRVIVPRYGEQSFCARFVPNGKTSFIFLYPMAWESRGCYGASPMLVLSHEMLHQLGLPPHFIPAYHWKEYINNDPIEITMQACIKEAKRKGRKLLWQSDQRNIEEPKPSRFNKFNSFFRRSPRFHLNKKVN